jgi:riboflavin kinase/FMN adenylyltransferase
MNRLTDRQRGGAVTIGNFDGVHRGHARIVERLIWQARRVAGPAIVFTFDPHPVRVLRPDLAPPPLTWTDRKAELLAELGVDAMVVYRTDEALLSLSPDEFFQRVVREQLAARAMVEGPNFFFGRDRSGDIDRLRLLCERHRVALEVVEPLRCGTQYISSSRIRSAIAAGDVAEARRLLTRPYRIRGLVTHGAGRGAKIGFPTANVDAIDTLLPAYGVYAGRARVAGQDLPAAINIGPNPTFGQQVLKVEVHILDYDRPLYGQPLEVDFVARLRDIQTFRSVEQLVRQLRSDIAAVRDIIEQENQEPGHDH